MTRKYSITKLTILILAITMIHLPEARAQWQLDIPTPLPVVLQPDTVTVSIIGDVMMHSPQLKYDFHPFLERLGDVTMKPELSIANMEFSLGGPPYTGYPAFSAPDDYADYAMERGIDVFLTANNHILDRGRDGLERTQKVYQQMFKDHGTRYTGTYLDEESDTLINPLIVAVHGVRIALVNFTYGTNAGEISGTPNVKLMKKEEVRKMIDIAQRKEVDYIIALPHWGLEYKLHHSPAQQEWAEWLVDQGVDVIVGAHPHVIQDTTHIKGVPVFYSIGNAISNMSAPNTQLELAVKLRFIRFWNGDTRMLEPEYEFLWCTRPGALIDNYTTIKVSDYLGKRYLWKDPSDYDKMVQTLERIKKTLVTN